MQMQMQYLSFSHLVIKDEDLENQTPNVIDMSQVMQAHAARIYNPTESCKIRKIRKISFSLSCVKAIKNPVGGTHLPLTGPLWLLNACDRLVSRLPRGHYLRGNRVVSPRPVYAFYAFYAFYAGSIKMYKRSQQNHFRGRFREPYREAAYQ